MFRRTLSAALPLAACLALAACADADAPKKLSADDFAHAADTMREHGDDVGAADMYQRILARSPDNVRVRTSLAEILAAHGDVRDAETQFAIAERQAPDDVDIRRKHADALLKLGRAAEAQDAYRKILADNPRDARTLDNLGIAQDFLGQHEAAQETYRNALEMDSGNVNVVNNLAHSYVLSGDYESAIGLLEPRAQDKNATPALRQNLAEAYGMKGMKVDAERLAKIDLAPDQVRKNLAHFHDERLRLGLAQKFAADLGSYRTEALAQVRVNDIKTKFVAEVAGLAVKVEPSLEKSGGVPIFAMRAYGFQSATRLQTFCAALKKEGTACKPVVYTGK